jgi:NAD-dependent DNA ligase
MTHFGDIDKLRAASVEQIREVDGFGPKLAAELHQFLHRGKTAAEEDAAAEGEEHAIGEAGDIIETAPEAERQPSESEAPSARDEAIELDDALQMVAEDEETEIEPTPESSKEEKAKE